MAHIYQNTGFPEFRSNFAVKIVVKSIGTGRRARDANGTATHNL